MRMKRKGMTLLVLVISMIVMIILAGVTIINLTKNNPISSANNAVFVTNIKSMFEMVELFHNNKFSEDPDYERTYLNWNGTSEIATLEDDKGDITEIPVKEVLGTDLPDSLKNKLKIVKGDLLLFGITAEQSQAAAQVGVGTETPKVPDAIDDSETITEEKFISYPTAVLSDYGITATVDPSGQVMLNGKANKNLYIRVSKKLDIASSIDLDEKSLSWIQEQKSEPYVKAGQKIVQKVSILSGSFTAKPDELNLMTRYLDNSLASKCQIANGRFEDTTIATQDICVQYIYIAEKVVVNNLKLKIETVKKIVTPGEIADPNFPIGTTLEKGAFSCKVNTDGTITLNGKPGKCFLRISDHLYRATAASEKDFISSSAILVNSGQIARLSCKVISGTVTGTECNLCLRYSSPNAMALKCLLIKGEKSSDIVVSSNATIIYLYFTADCVCDNYTILPKIEAVTRDE